MKTLHCRNAGFDCEGVICANSDNEVLTKLPSMLCKNTGFLLLQNLLNN